MTPNWTLLIVRNGHALSPEGGPCILSIQRDASFLGTPLWEQEQPLNCHHGSGDAANGVQNISKGDIPGTSVVGCLRRGVVYVYFLHKLSTDCSLPFSDLPTGALWALLKVGGFNASLYRLKEYYRVAYSKRQGLLRRREGLVAQ